MEDLMTRAPAAAKIHADAVGAIDCDVHPYFPDGIRSLRPQPQRQQSDQRSALAQVVGAVSIEGGRVALGGLRCRILLFSGLVAAAPALCSARWAEGGLPKMTN